jgi:hypothetical protein
MVKLKKKSIEKTIPNKKKTVIKRIGVTSPYPG